MPDAREQSASSIALTQLARRFTAHVPDGRKPQMEPLARVVSALLQSKDVRPTERAERFPGNAQASSVIRRIDRSFDRRQLCPAEVARVVLMLLPVDPPARQVTTRIHPRPYESEQRSRHTTARRRWATSGAPGLNAQPDHSPITLGE